MIASDTNDRFNRRSLDREMYVVWFARSFGPATLAQSVARGIVNLLEFQLRSMYSPRQQEMERSRWACQQPLLQFPLGYQRHHGAFSMAAVTQITGVSKPICLALMIKQLSHECQVPCQSAPICNLTTVPLYVSDGSRKKLQLVDNNRHS